MTRLFSLKKIVFAAVAVAGLSFAAGSANAGGYGYGGGYGYAPSYYLKKVVTYDYQYIDDYYYVTKYDHCGVPYQHKVLYQKQISVPVVSYVKVYY